MRTRKISKNHEIASYYDEQGVLGELEDVTVDINQEE